MSGAVNTCRTVALLAILLIMCGCAASSTFTAYPRKIEPLIASLSVRNPTDLSTYLLSESTGRDQILYNMERGRYAQIIGNTDASMADFSASIRKIRENDEMAVISASAAGATVAATLVNDNVIPYEGAGYERVLLHHYQALNYLEKNDLEGAGVEVRLANAEQNEALQRFEHELDWAREEAEEKHIGGRTSAVESRYAQMDEMAGRVKNSFQNAYTFYVSGFIYELLRQPNDAYIDYKKALEIYPENRYVQQDVLRLAAGLGMNDDLAELKKRFSAEKRTVIDENGPGSGELLVLFEDGFVPQKQEIKIPVPIGGSGLVAIAFPIYQGNWTPVNPLLILDNNVLLGSTEPICDVRALAVKALKEQVPVLAARQIARAVAKGVAAAEARKNMGGFGQFATIIWNLVSENADLRSWLTLPANAQILRTTLPAGSHRLTLQHPQAGIPADVDVEIPGGGKTVLHIVRAGQQLYWSVTPFYRLL